MSGKMILIVVILCQTRSECTLNIFMHARIQIKDSIEVFSRGVLHRRRRRPSPAVDVCCMSANPHLRLRPSHP